MEANCGDAVTKPTLDTILERIDLVAEDLRAFRLETAKTISAIRDEIAVLRVEVRNLRNEFHLFRAEVEIRLDRLEG